jgi:hypothetical protein
MSAPKLLAAFLAIVATVTLSEPASACWGPDFHRHYLHDTLPPLTGDIVAFSVEVTGMERVPLGHLAAHARVISRMRGNFAGTRIRLESKGLTDCDIPPRPGEAGIVIGRVLRKAPNLLVIAPIRTRSEYQRRAAFRQN